MSHSASAAVASSRSAHAAAVLTRQSATAAPGASQQLHAALTHVNCAADMRWALSIDRRLHGLSKINFPRLKTVVSFAPLMMFVYRKVSGLRPVERHISATCSAACESRAAAQTDTCRRRRPT